MFVLFDSRARAHTKRRKAYQFPETPQGLRNVWDLVVRDEAPDEYNDYIGLSEWLPDDPGEGIYEPCVVFNDYWACYGWYLNSYEEDADCPDDVDMQN